MKVKDARSLSTDAKEALRLRAVKAYLSGSLTQEQVAREFSVTRQMVNAWVQKYRRGGEDALKAKKPGPPFGGGLLTPEQEQKIQEIIRIHTPDQAGLPDTLWTRAAVRELVERQTGIRVAVRTVGKWLKKWGFTPQKPIRRALEQNSQAVRHWVEHEYPRLVQAAQKEGAEIQWGDEMGAHAEEQDGRSFSPRGHKPVIRRSGKRCRCNLIASVSNEGLLRFLVFTPVFAVPVFLEFLSRLIRRAERKVYLIVDRHSVHQAQKVQKWIKKNEEKIRLIYLPSYSPELNPVEFMNQDVKSNAVRKRRAKDQEDLMANVRGYMRSTQKQPHIVQNYFKAPSVQYALPVSNK